MPSSLTYLDQREAFRQAAWTCGASMDSLDHDGRGPFGERLATDLAYLGAARPRALLVVSSGLHGIEGVFGSRLQSELLRACSDARLVPKPDTGLLLVHALNPYGFAWQQRTNSRNVDLNRNFLTKTESFDDASECQAPWWLRDGRNRSLARLRLRLVAAAIRRGRSRLRGLLTQGQHSEPGWLFYAGARAAAETRRIQSNFRTWCRGAQVVHHLDIHTGLGAPRTDKLLTVDGVSRRHLAAIYGERRVQAVGRGVASRPSARGSMGRWLRQAFGESGQQYTYGAIEFGTVPGPRVLKALIDEQHARSAGSANHPATTDRLRDCFAPCSERWWAWALRTGIDRVGQGLRSGLHPIVWPPVQTAPPLANAGLHEMSTAFDLVDAAGAAVDALSAADAGAGAEAAAEVGAGAAAGIGEVFGGMFEF